MAKSLHIELGGRGLGYVPLGGQPLVLGRGVDCDVQIPDQRLSRRHCQVELREGRLMVSDLNSSNGTFVRGQRLTEPVHLDLGGSLYMGKTRIVFADSPVSGRHAPRGDENVRTVGMAPPTRRKPLAVAGPPVPPMVGATPAFGNPGLMPPPGSAPRSPLMPPSGQQPRAAAPPPDGALAAASRRNLKETISDPTLIDGYQVFDELGRGAMGVVYSARSIELERVCVLKTIKFSGSAKDAIFFIRECQAGMKIRHPNVVELLDFGEAAGRLFMAMEYVRGGNLLEHIQTHGPLDQRTACRQMITLSGALEYAFKQRFVHRDIKPANV
ncbi:MAG: protein kinase domain-containing protein, partial [Planctomycetota bacterium]